MSLYKYTAINEYTIQNLINNHIYFQSPNHFNDPYEFIFEFNVEDSIYHEFLQKFYEDKFIEVKDHPKEEILENTRDHYFGDFRCHLGVSCLTENANNDVMWAHYGDNHRGICIEYDIAQHPFNHFEKVKYVNEVFVVHISDLSRFDEQMVEIFNQVLLRKHFIWAYENEWRLIFPAKSFITYPSEAIKSITFGFFCTDEVKKKIFESTAHLDIKYFEVVRSKNTYTIAKMPIERVYPELCVKSKLM